MSGDPVVRVGAHFAGWGWSALSAACCFFFAVLFLAAAVQSVVQDVRDWRADREARRG